MKRRLRALRWTSIACFGAATAACSAPPASPVRTASGIAQGTTYSLQWIGGGAEDEIAVAAEQELERIDALLSNYRNDSRLEQFNAARGIEPVELPAELVTLFALAKRVHAASGGCFDPTVRPLVRAWGFDGDEPAVPAATALEAARALVGLDRLELLDATHVRKVTPQLELDMASIGQGYTVGRLADLLERAGSSSFLAEIGGEIVARGAKPDRTPWRIGLENPSDRPLAGAALSLPVDARTGIVTSGSYRHYFEVEGRRFGHIIDPRTGEPVEHGLLAVTVVGEDPAAAAAWGTALLCLGPVAGMAAAERENLAVLFWLDREGTPTLEQSPKFVAEWSQRLAERAAP